MRHKLKGPSRAAATACAAGADAIGEAFHLIRGGHADVMVAGGTEACVDAVALAAFGRRAPGGSPELCTFHKAKTQCVIIIAVQWNCAKRTPKATKAIQQTTYGECAKVTG